MHLAQVCALLSGLLLCQPAIGQATKTRRPVQINGQLSYDSFFGFYPTLSVSKSLDSLHEIRAYSTFYTNPDFFGNETGLTLSITSPRKTWSVMPGAAVVSGSFFVMGRSFRIGEGYFGSLAVQHERAGWYVEGYGGYYGILQRITPDAYDFGFYTAQAGRIIAGQIHVGVLYAWLGNVQLPRNGGDISEFAVSRIGLAANMNLGARLNIQVGGGLTHGADQRAFVQLSLARQLSRLSAYASK